MKSSPMEMYEPSYDDRANNKENIVLRSLVGDPNRHVPLADHRPPSTYSNEEKLPASLYTIDTRYQPIPSKALPKPTDPRVSYIDSIRREETPIATGRMTHRPTPIPDQNEPPTLFLQPKVVSQPILYSIIDAKYSPAIFEQPIPTNKQPDSSPKLYAMADRPRRQTLDINENKAPTVYTVVGSPRLPKAHEEPTPNPSQPTPLLYSITGNPARASRAVQVNTFDPDRPAPILYTIVGDSPNRTHRSMENPVAASKTLSTTDVVPYTVSNEQNTPRVYYQQPPMEKPSFYTIVGQPNSSYADEYTRSSVRKRTPPPPGTMTISTTRSTTRSLERKPEVVRDEVINYPVKEKKQPPLSREPKTEAIYIPAEQRRTRPPPPPSQSNPKPYITSQTQPAPLTNYRTYKTYRQHTYNDNNTLPAVTHTHPNRKPRPPLYEPRYQPEKHYPYHPNNHTSLERYPVDPHPTLWNNGYQSDEEQGYAQRMNKKKRIYKAPRPRVPWVPVW